LAFDLHIKVIVILKFYRFNFREAVMTDNHLEKRDRLAYLALYYAIHGDDERSEKIRRALRTLDESSERELVAVPVHA
jgi:predicted transcriptional regulator